MIRYFYEGPILHGELHVVKLEGEYNSHRYFITTRGKVRCLPPYEVFETPEDAMADARHKISQELELQEKLQAIRREHLEKWPTYKLKVV